MRHHKKVNTMNLTLTEKLQYSTIRIECKDKNGNLSTGTGFFFNFLQTDKGNVPVIITNKHVIKNNETGRLLFTIADENGNPIDSFHHTFNISPNFENAWRLHPDPNVDLCAMPIAEILYILKEQNMKPFFAPFDKSLIPSKEQLNDLGAMEEIIMVGYPNGIWDSVNNQPILRKGITATHPNKDYCGKKEFMADIASFPGSSGSPVLIYNHNGYKDRNGNFYMKERFFFLGILYAGPQHTTIGQIYTDYKNTPISVSNIPNNLGLIIKSERIEELELLFKE